jgi:hypothetical protein
MIADLDRVFNREWTLMHANGLMKSRAAIRVNPRNPRKKF